jgi:phosphoglycerate dehydrogenase-like enzyme
MKKALFIMIDTLVHEVYDEEAQKIIHENFDVIGDPLTKDNYLEQKELLAEVEVIFSGWGAPTFDRKFLEAAPNLEAIFYAAGTMKTLLSDEVWEKNITVATANTANAVPVAEYTLSQILFSLKNGWQITRNVREDREFHFNQYQMLGAYKRTVGLISLSQVGRKTLELLKPFDLEVIAYDPFVDEEEAEKLGVRMVSLEELFETANIVSLHSPLLPETEGMITGELFATMKTDSTFINTARGAIVKEDELIDVFKERTDLTAILDVTHPEPPLPESPLYDMDNIVITPHIAGSAGSEVARMGKMVADEALRYAKQEPLKYQISKEDYRTMA